MLDKLSYQQEYDRNFVSGTKVGRSVGKNAGKEYLLSTVKMRIEQ